MDPGPFYRYFFMKTSWNIALGFYQSLKTAEEVLHKLKNAGLKRSAYIHCEHYGKISSKSNGIFCRVDASVLNRFKKLVIRDETLVIVQVHSKDVSRALSILRHVESGHPTSFLLRTGVAESQEKAELIKEPLTTDALCEHAKELAGTLKEVGYKKTNDVTLLKNLRQCEKSLAVIQHVVAEAEFVEQTITLAAEWLLDNSYVIQGNIEEVFRNLPEKYYHELPKVLKGPLAGLPRVYIIAKDIVNYTANRLSRENIIAFSTVIKLLIN